MLARLVRDLDSSADVVAERVVQLRGVAEGTIRSIHRRSTLNPYPVAIDGLIHLATLATGIAATAATVRHAIQDVPAEDDPVTVDILTDVLRSLDRWSWYVQAHLEGDSDCGGPSNG